MTTIRRSLLAMLGLLAVGCQLPLQATSIEGPALMLTAEQPVAAFEIRLCLSGPKMRWVNVEGRVAARAKTEVGSAVLEMEALDRPRVEDDEDDPYAHSMTIDAGEETLGIVELVTDGSFRANGVRCSAAEVLQFTADGLAPGAQLNVYSWDVSMVVEWSDGVLGEGPDEDELWIELEPL